MRARPEDVDQLAVRFCRRFGVENGRGELEISSQALALLKHQPWPGNVRQLQNFVERLVVLSDGDRLTAADVERELGRQATLGGLTEAGSGGGKDGASSAGSLEASRRDAEREAIGAALERSGNNRTVAARLLGISRRTLYHKLAEHALL